MATSATALAPLLAALDLPAHSRDTEKAQRAMALAERLYEGKKHWTGVTLLEHTLGVLSVLVPFRPDIDTICACLLQHVLKTREIGVGELSDEFGVEVRNLISSIHLLSHVTMRSRSSSIEDLRLMLLSVSDDVRVLLIILCDRCYVLERLTAIPPAEARRICRDVLNLFAPVAARLGIHTLKQRLEALAFPIVYPLDAEWISEQINSNKRRHGDFLPKAAAALAEALQQQGITAVVQGREKLQYSIFTKLKSKGLSAIESLPDLFALRVIVDTEEDCYRALGLLHRMGRPVTNRFKDYISFPKPNGYRSLHTTISRLPVVPENVFVEVQVRTHQMHREAEYGIAAHWSYKEGGDSEQMLRRVQLQQVLNAQQPVQGTGGPTRLADHIFVLTPKGDIVELPEGATPLDFAFQIHTDLGLTFRTARVNGSIVPLDYELENGDVVEIVTQSSAKPSPEWLQLLKMASSRTRLRRYLHSIDRDVYIERGKAMVNAELKSRRLSLLDADLSVLRRYDGKYLSFDERQDRLMKIGQAADKVSSLFRHLDLLRVASPLPRAVPTRRPVRPAASDSPIEVDGGVPMPIKFAKCCTPQEGDRERIVGAITRSGQVIVHRSKCRMAKKGNPGRRIGVRWRKIA